MSKGYISKKKSDPLKRHKENEKDDEEEEEFCSCTEDAELETLNTTLKLEILERWSYLGQDTHLTMKNINNITVFTTNVTGSLM
jgi:hypothetical protein